MGKKKDSDSTIAWLGFAALLLGLGYIWLKQQLGLIDFGNPSVPFQKLEGSSIKLGITIPIINSSSLAARVTGFTGVIKAPDGGVIGRVFLNQPVSINRYDQAELKFTAMIRLTDILSEVADILQGGGKVNWKGYVVKGQVRIYGFPIPLETALF